MKREEILNVVNNIAKNEIHDKSTFKQLSNEEQSLIETGIDSFDFIMVYMKLGEHFGIADKDFKEKLPDANPSLNVLIDFILEYSDKSVVA
jgi:acyl carrier protein